MKYVLMLLCFVSFNAAKAQVLYEDNESTQLWNFDWSSGVYQRAVEAPDDAQRKVTRYERSASQYDVLRLNLRNKLMEVEPYLTGSKKFRIDFYSAHPGTTITLVLSNAAKASGAYPAGRHSEFTATTTKNNQWETLEFQFIFQPDQQVVLPELDQFYFMIAPNTDTTTGQIYYFDNFYGPDFKQAEISVELYENAEDISRFTYPWSSGVLTRAAVNPDPDTINSSSLVLQYQRSTSAYDVLYADVNHDFYLTPYLTGDRKMTLQVYSPAPGIRINLSLENKTKSSNPYPEGRHSEFMAVTRTSGQWETLVFDFHSLIDNSMTIEEVDRFTMLIAPNDPAAAGIYYLDNFFGPEILTQDFSNLSINEVMVSNGSTISDLEGDENDWIEIYNAGDFAVDLTGFYLSDDQTSQPKWAFPRVAVLGGEYLVVWASSKDKFQYGEVHTNFNLNSTGEHLLFSSPAGDTVDYFPPASMPADVSYGRQPDATGDYLLFTVPTPGSANTSTGYTGIQGYVSFSTPGGFYNQAIDLTITAAPDAEIRYTLDGSEPTDTSTLFTGPISISSRAGEANSISEIPTTATGTWIMPQQEQFKSRVVRARTFKAGEIPGPVVTHTYFIGDNVAQRYPAAVISLATDSANLFGYEEGLYVPGKTFYDWQASNPDATPGGLSPANYNREGDAWEKPVSVEFFEPDGVPGFSLNAGLAIHGGYSRSNPMKSLRIAFRNEYDTVNTINYPLFPGLKKRGNPDKDLTEYRRFLLRTSGNDYGRTMFRDAFMQKLLDHIPIDKQAYRPSIVFLNGEYWGLHNIRERIDDVYLANHHGIKPEEVTLINGSGTVDEGQPGDEEHYKQTIGFLETNNIQDSSAYAYVKSRIDVENFIQYQLAEIFYDNYDWPGNNVKLWRYKGNAPVARTTRDGRWRWIFYDLDYSFGIYRRDPANNTLEFATASDGPAWPNPPWSTFLLRTLLENEDFRKDFINYFSDHLNSSFKSDRMIAVIDQMQQTIEPLMQEHIHRWNEPQDMDDWYSQNDVMREFATQRPAHQVAHLMQHFTLSQPEIITVNVNDQTAGKVQVNSLYIDANLPGTHTSVYPWSGAYFPEVEVKVTAVPERGYKFIGWNGHNSSSRDTTVFVSDTTYLTAYFAPLTAEDLFPEAHILQNSKYELRSWDSNQSALTYPSSMIFLQSASTDPALNSAYPHLYDLPYNLTQGTRIEGRGEEGIAFINTGSTDNLYTGAAGRDLGCAVLALDTRNVSNVYLSFLAGTVEENSRLYGIRLQYRIGKDGTFQDLVSDGFVVEYLANYPGHNINFHNITLPAEAIGQEYVELRWVYHYVSGLEGKRAKLRLDNIVVSEEPLLALNSPHANAQVTLYPNPANEKFTFKISNSYAGEVLLTVSDVNGRQIHSLNYKKPSGEHAVQPDVNFPGKGIYFVKWKCGDNSGVEKIAVVD